MIENNRLIAEFLGSEIEETLKGEKVYCLLMPDENDISGFKKEFFGPSELKFHNDWNWLMLVVNKIESSPQCEVVIDKDLVEIYYKTYRKSFKEVSTSKIEATYEACVEFIKWYNEYI